MEDERSLSIVKEGATSTIFKSKTSSKSTSKKSKQERITTKRRARVKKTSVQYERGNTVLDNQKSIPTKIFYVAVSQMKREAHYTQLAVYVIFLAFYCFINFSIRNTHNSFEQMDKMVDELLDEEFEFGKIITHDNVSYVTGPQFKKNFYEVMEPEEFWSWVEGPLLKRIFGSRSFYGSPQGNQTIDNSEYEEQTHILGKVRFRTVRVTNQSCNLFDVGAYEHLKKPSWWPSQCFGAMDYSHVQREDFCRGPCKGKQSGYKFLSKQSSIIARPGYGSNYGSGSFIQDMPHDKAETKKLLQDMKKDGWIDASTRVITVEFNAYNPNSKLITVVRVQFQLSMTTRFAVWNRIVVLPAGVYGTDSRFILRLGAELVFLAFFAYYLVLECRQIRRERWDYFKDVWNVVEFVNFALYISVITCYVYFTQLDHVSKVHETVVFNEEFVDLYATASFMETVGMLSSINLVVGIIKTFKMFQLNRRIMLMWDTLQRAMLDIVASIVVLLIVLAGFAFMGHMVFGSRTRNFHDIGTSFSVLFRGSLGNLDYEEIQLANPWFAMPFFISYVFVVFLVITNMFIAVINQYYEEAKREELEEQDVLASTTSMVPSMQERVLKSKELVQGRFNFKMPSFFNCICCQKKGIKSRRTSFSVGMNEDKPRGDKGVKKLQLVDVVSGAPDTELKLTIQDHATAKESTVPRTKRGNGNDVRLTKLAVSALNGNNSSKESDMGKGKGSNRDLDGSGLSLKEKLTSAIRNVVKRQKPKMDLKYKIRELLAEVSDQLYHRTSKDLYQHFTRTMANSKASLYGNMTVHDIGDVFQDLVRAEELLKLYSALKQCDPNVDKVSGEMQKYIDTKVIRAGTTAVGGVEHRQFDFILERLGEIDKRLDRNSKERQFK